MQKKFLGDSYDIVKRFWKESLDPVAPLYAHAKFIPNDKDDKLHEPYTALTCIPIIEPQKITAFQGSFGILLDPDTGVYSPETRRNTSKRHVPLSFILDLLDPDKGYCPKYIICFDQSYHRQHKRGLRKNQMAEKMAHLEHSGLYSFYYDSHASFLFVARSSEVLGEIKRVLVGRGLPANRLFSLPLEGHSSRSVPTD